MSLENNIVPFKIKENIINNKELDSLNQWIRTLKCNNLVNKHINQHFKIDKILEIPILTKPLNDNDVTKLINFYDSAFDNIILNILNIASNIVDNDKKFYTCLNTFINITNLIIFIYYFT